LSTNTGNRPKIDFKKRLANRRALRTGSSLPVALHGRISPPQFLSATGPSTLAWLGLSPSYVVDFTAARCRPYGAEDSIMVGWLQTCRATGAGFRCHAGWKLGTFPSQQAPYADRFMPLSRQDKFEMGGVIPDTTVSGLFPRSLRDYLLGARAICLSPVAMR